MKKATLERKIDGFLSRKLKQHADLDRSVAEITRELEAQDRATTILHWAEEPRAVDLDREYSYQRGGSLQYAM